MIIYILIKIINIKLFALLQNYYFFFQVLFGENSILKLLKINYNLIIFLIILLIIIFIMDYFYKLLKLLFQEKEKLSIEKSNLNEKQKIYNQLNYYNEYNLYRLLCPKKVVGKKKILIGNYGDGGYVMLDNFKGIKIAYSFGISNLNVFLIFDKYKKLSYHKIFLNYFSFHS